MVIVERQAVAFFMINTSLNLWFRERDAVSEHLLSATAADVLKGIGKAEGIMSHVFNKETEKALRLPWALKVRKRALSGNHRKSDTCQIRHTRNRDPTGFIEEPRTPIDFDEQVVDRRKQMQWKRKLAGKRMAPVTSDANAAIRCAIQHLKIGRAAGKTDLARACSLKRIAAQNEKLVPLHTKRIS